MEFKEVKRKNGQVIVFCNFEDLLKEAYGVKSMEEVLPHANDNGEYIIHCPFCKQEGHTKHKLYIKDDLTVGHCFVCTRTYVNVDDKVDLSFSIPDFLPYFGYSGLNLVKLEDPIWSLDKYFNEFDDYDEKGVNYLIGRHKYMAELYKALDFKFLDGNIVMPFKYHGEVFYYQLRFTGNSNIRYFFPPISKKPPYIIDHGGGKIRKICIVEGVYDAISMLIQAPDYIPCAVLGSSISDYQIEFIREYVPKEILIYMDKTEISIKIARKLVTRIDYCPIKIHYSDGTDPEEMMKKRMSWGGNKEIAWIK